MKPTRPKILLTNDDGIDAPGIRALHAAIRGEYDVLVVAPMYEKSGAGCSLSLSNEMEVRPRRDDDVVWGHAVDGTPADCVKFAVTALADFQPDFVLSGINRGMNVGNSVFYSGTVAGAIEGTLFGFPAMACSLAMNFHKVETAHYDAAAQVVKALLPWLLKQRTEPRTLWNLNIPNRPLSKLGAIRFTSHGTSFFADEFARYREEENAVFYKNVGSKLMACARNEDADDRIVTAGDISLSLLRTDLTVDPGAAARAALEKEWNGLLGRRE